MECKKVEELLSSYIEKDIEEGLHKEVTLHLEKCGKCRKLKGKMEELIFHFPDLEEDVPFFLKNRLYYIPESQESEEVKYSYLKWVAAVIGTFILFLNLFYFTNIYPPANRTLHNMVAGIKTFAVETGAFLEKVKESKDLVIYSFVDNEPDQDKIKRNNNVINRNGG